LHYPLNLRHRDPSLGEVMANPTSDPAAVAYRRVSSSEKVIHYRENSFAAAMFLINQKITLVEVPTPSSCDAIFLRGLPTPRRHRLFISTALRA
jgi:hypothetical protein